MISSSHPPVVLYQFPKIPISSPQKEKEKKNGRKKIQH